MSKDKKLWKAALTNSWNKWTPPDRPSPGELAVYEESLKRILQKKKNPKLMVLGSTSEFRDLFAKYKLPCTVVDYREENYVSMSTLMRAKKYKEKLLTQDWRVLRTVEKYDLVLGDFCVNVLSKADLPKLVSSVAGILNKDGICMLKTFVRYDDKKGDLAKSLEFYRTKKKDRPILETVMATMFKSAYNYETESGDFKIIWQNFVKLYEEKKMKKDEFDYFSSLKLGEITLKYYIPYFEDLLKIVEKNASLLGVRYGGEWFSTDVPILIFKK